MANNTKPEIDFIDGPAPAELVITDLEVGDGAEAAPGATVDVHYVGVDYETGEQFDASWDRGSSIGAAPESQQSGGAHKRTAHSRNGSLPERERSAATASAPPPH